MDSVPRHDRHSPRTVEAVLAAALSAQRIGGLAEWAHRYPRVLRWLRSHWLAPVIDSLGDALPVDQRDAAALHADVEDTLTDGTDSVESDESDAKS